MERLRVIFMGSAELACASLRALRTAEFCELLAVVTQPDQPKGRDLKLSATPVGGLAAELGLPHHKPRRARDAEFVEMIRSLRPDLMVVVAYGQILPLELLEVPRHGCLNVHTSILPKYRGAAPIQWAIVNGETETGVSIMKMDAGLDTGPVIAETRTPITDDDDSQRLHDRLATLGAVTLLRTIPAYVAGHIKLVAQPATGSTYARKIIKEDGRIDWSRPARAIFNQVRGFNPWPGAFTSLTVGGQPRLLKVWRAQIQPTAGGPPGAVLRADPDGLEVGCADRGLRILELQLEGSRRMPASEFLAGHPVTAGHRLG